MNEQIARHVGPSGIDIAYERFGPADAPAVLLIMGGGAQMIMWPEGLCAELVDRGLQVIRFDNRDVGHSTHLGHLGVPDFQAGLAGDVSSAGYRLEDMAADAIGLLDALGIARAHMVGASLGGQIAQILAAEYPQRVPSLVSMMSWTGSRAVGQPAPETSAIFKLPPVTSRQQAMDNAVVIYRAIGSPGFAFDEAAVRERAGLAFDRGYDVQGLTRQAMAAMASGDRTAKLAGIHVPTLVIHGLADRMVDVSGGRATAAAIPGARLELFEGMGHSLPRELWPRFATLIAEHVHAVEQVS